MDGQTDTMKQTVIYHNFANTPNKYEQKCLKQLQEMTNLDNMPGLVSKELPVCPIKYQPHCDAPDFL